MEIANRIAETSGYSYGRLALWVVTQERERKKQQYKSGARQYRAQHMRKFPAVT